VRRAVDFVRLGLTWCGCRYVTCFLDQLFVADSYDTFAKKMMVESGFLNILLDFSTKDKDNINEETMELLEPYLKVSDFHPERAKTVSSAAEGLCKWVSHSTLHLSFIYRDIKQDESTVFVELQLTTFLA
jgi:hypothetical protein